jgi:hypothetical protein
VRHCRNGRRHKFISKTVSYDFRALRTRNSAC